MAEAAQGCGLPLSDVKVSAFLKERDAYDFVSNKPLVLIDGQTLLALLAKHGFKFKLAKLIRIWGFSRMIVEGVEKKVREARFFLDRMIEHERMAFDDKEPFDFYLSAFLGAGRTVDYRLRHEQKAIYPIWRHGWDATLNQAQQDLIKFMIDDRNVEVHASGSSRVVKTEARELGTGRHSLARGTIEVFGPPDISPRWQPFKRPHIISLLRESRRRSQKHVKSIWLCCTKWWGSSKLTILNSEAIVRPKSPGDWRRTSKPQ
jgi:hypothetical protein